MLPQRDAADAPPCWQPFPGGYAAAPERVRRACSGSQGQALHAAPAGRSRPPAGRAELPGVPPHRRGHQWSDLRLQGSDYSPALRSRCSACRQRAAEIPLQRVPLLMGADQAVPRPQPAATLARPAAQGRSRWPCGWHLAEQAMPDGRPWRGDMMDASSQPASLSPGRSGEASGRGGASVPGRTSQYEIDPLTEIIHRERLLDDLHPFHQELALLGSVLGVAGHE